MSLLKVSDNYSASIVGNFAAAATTITVDIAPVKTAGYLTVFDLDGNQLEKIKYTGVSGLNLTGCIRGLSFDDNSDTPVAGNAKELKNGMAIKMTVSQHYLNPVIDFVNQYNGKWMAAVADYAALVALTGSVDGEVRVTLDDSKIYIYDLDTTTWYLAGAGGGAGTVYITTLLGTESTGDDNLTFTMASGSFPDKKYLQVYKNGVLMGEGALNDYVATGSNQAVFNEVVLDDDVITLLVVSVDIYNPAWNNVTGDILPDADNTHDIGSTAKKFKDGHFTGKLYSPDITPVGAILPYACAAAPAGWLLADGSAVSRATYADLFTAISTLYGVGDNSTTFNLPNLKNRIPIGLDVAVKVVIDNCDAAWTAGANVTASNDTGDKKEGTGSVKLAVAAGAGAGQILGYKAITSMSLVGKTRIGLWIKSSIALSAGDLKYQLDDTAALASVIESIDIPVLAAGIWTKVYLTLATPSLDTAIISHGIYQVNDKGAFDLWIDDVNDGENYELGATGGEKNHVLTVAELAAHNHEITNYQSGNGAYPHIDTIIAINTLTNITTSNTGSNTPHNNLQPYITLNYIIKY